MVFTRSTMVSAKENKKMYVGGFSTEEAKAVADSLNIDFSKVDYTLSAFRAGMEVELEHASVTHKEAIKTGKIALDHLREDPKYYTKLKKVEKSVGLPTEMDVEHEYIYKTGFHSIVDYWWRDFYGNYIRYTNAPVDSKDYNPLLGEPLVHPEQPLPTTNPEYFTEEGFKRHQAVAAGLIPRRNPEYDPFNPKELWFEVVESAGLVRYIYLDADVRENLDLWVQYQLRLADASLLQYRKYAYDLFKSKHPKDRITAVILFLIDQAYFLPEQLADLTVADITFIDNTIKLGPKKITCDPDLLDFFTSLVKDREPEDPLFVLQTIHGRNSLGYNYIYAVLSSLKMNPFYLIAWHANHIFSKVLNRMSLEGIPVEEASVKVYTEVTNAMCTADNILVFIDTKVKNTLLENYEETINKGLTTIEQDSYGVSYIYSDLVERRSDEVQFSIWLHSEPMHDISPAEQEVIEETMAKISEEEVPTEEEDRESADNTQAMQSTNLKQEVQ